MMWITESDVRMVEDFSTAAIASDVGVPLQGGSSLSDRVQRIRATDARAAEVLQEFHAAYQEWFDFHKRLDATGAAGDPTELSERMDRRDSTRQALLEYRAAIARAGA